MIYPYSRAVVIYNAFAYSLKVSKSNHINCFVDFKLNLNSSLLFNVEFNSGFSYIKLRNLLLSNKFERYIIIIH